MSTILIVDDLEQNRYLVRAMLSASGNEVLEAANGVQALELARRTKPDLIVSDILMPQMDGFALCRECKNDEQLRDIPFVFYTATYTDPRDQALALQQGAARFIIKPVEGEEFLAILQEVLQAHAAGHLTAPAPQAQEETSFYRLYNESLIRKLEEKMLELERLNGSLAQSEERFRNLAENAQDLIYRYEFYPQRGFTYVSPAATTITGYTPEEHYADPDLGFKLVHPDDRHLLEAASQVKTTPGAPLSLRWVRKDGQIIWTEQRNVPIVNQAGELIAIEGIARDVTGRKQRERELEAMAAVSGALRVAPTRAEMLPIILDQLLTQLEVDGAALAMLDPASGELRTELGRGVWAALTGETTQPDTGLDAQILATGQPYLNNEVSSDSRLLHTVDSDPCRAVAGAPLVARGQTIGVLSIGSTHPLTNHDLRLLVAIADMVANAIHRAALYEETARRVQQLEALKSIDRAITSSFDLRTTLNILLDNVVTQLRADAAAVLLLDQHQQILSYASVRGFRTRKTENAHIRMGENPAGRVALERRIVQVSDLSQVRENPQFAELWAGEGFASYYGVPLTVKGQVRGVLEVYRRASFHPDSDWLGFLDTLAGQAALAVDNAQLFQNLERSNTDLILAYDTTIEVWSHALEVREKEPEGHTLHVAEMTMRLGKAMGIGDPELVQMRRGALLHDVGMMNVPDSILLKPGKLTDDEWKIIRMHPEFASNLMSPINYLRPALDIPYCHHEKWDGTGYPRGLAGTQIPLAARVFAVVDVWDALHSNRPYRAAWPEDKVLEHFRAVSGTHFDPDVVEAFMRVLNKDIWVRGSSDTKPSRRSDTPRPSRIKR